MAQVKTVKLIHKVDSVLTGMYNKVDYDTAYMSRPGHRFKIKLLTNLSRFELIAKGKDMELDWKNKPRSSASIEVSFLDVSAGFSINTSGIGDKNKDLEFNLNSYGNRFSIDGSYLVSKTVAGNTRYYDNSFRINEGLLKWKTLNVTGYYTFNYRHFSFPAAFSQSYIQKRSAGSFLAGLTYQNHSIKVLEETESDYTNIRQRMDFLSVGGGYGYNYVPNKRWLFHLSSLPTLVVYAEDVVKMDDTSVRTKIDFPTFILNGRAAVIYNFNTKYFAGLTLVGNKLINRHKGTTTEENKWLGKLFFGFRW